MDEDTGFAIKNIKTLYYENAIELFLVNEYEERFEYLLAEENALALDTLGTAISEPNRVEIFKLMHIKGEITIKDIEQTMKISGTNAYYHLMLMLKANIVQTRNKGRTVYYSINRSHIDKVCRYIGQFGTNSMEVK